MKFNKVGGDRAILEKISEVLSDSKDGQSFWTLHSSLVSRYILYSLICLYILRLTIFFIFLTFFPFIPSLLFVVSLILTPCLHQFFNPLFLRFVIFHSFDKVVTSSWFKSGEGRF